VRRALYMRGYASPAVSGTRPNTAVERGFYALPYISALPMPQLPQIRQPGRPTLRGPSRRRLRGLGQTSGVPAGTVLVYSAQVGFVFETPSITSLVQQIAPLLSAENINIISQTGPGAVSGVLSPSAQAITLTVQVTGGFSQPSDIQSLIDSAIASVANGPIGSSIQATQAPVPVGSPGTPSYVPYTPYVPPSNVGVTPPPQPPPDITDWLSQNWPLLALGAAGLLVAGPIVRDLF